MSLYFGSTINIFQPRMKLTGSRYATQGGYAAETKVDDNFGTFSTHIFNVIRPVTV